MWRMTFSPRARGGKLLVVVCAAVSLAAGCGGRAHVARTVPASMLTRTAGASQGGDQSAASLTVRTEEQLVVEGAIDISVVDVQKTVVAIRDRVRGAKGRVITEEVHGAAQSWSGTLRIRVPPGTVPTLVDWLGGQGEITRKRINATDVSRKLFDQEIALANMQRTLDRLRKLLDAPGLALKDILVIETEMRRLRRSIETVKGERRWLRDRVSLATIDVKVTRRKGAVFGPKAKLYPGPRVSTLSLVGKGAGGLRLGAGFVIGVPPIPGKTGAPRVTFELDIFERGDTGSRAVTVTTGTAIYSDFMGRGERRFLNPYIEFRLGYGYLDGSRFVLASGAGVELFKHKYLVVDANVRAVGFISDSAELGVVGGTSVLVAF